jgi:WD40 repeat protein
MNRTPDGSRVVTFGLDHKLKIFKICFAFHPFKRRITFDSLHEEKVLEDSSVTSCVNFSVHDMQLMICGCSDGKIKVWNYITGTKVREFGVENPVSAFILIENPLESKSVKDFKMLIVSRNYPDLIFLEGGHDSHSTKQKSISVDEPFNISEEFGNPLVQLVKDEIGTVFLMGFNQMEGQKSLCKYKLF